MNKICAILLLFAVPNIYGQEFQTTFYAEKGNAIDSVVIGYDLSASISIDPSFGEIDIINEPFNTLFEIRVGQIDLNQLSCDENNLLFVNNLITYMSKVDIVPRDCYGYDNNTTINGLAPISSLFIRNKDLPVILRWDSAIFDNVCLNTSLITDWHPGGWFDAACPDLAIEPTQLSGQDSILINNPSGIYIIDPHNDTLSMFHIALGGMTVDVYNIEEEEINIFPNPTSGLLKVAFPESGSFSINVYNALGVRLLSGSHSEIDLTRLIDGIYYLKITDHDRSFVKIVYKYGQ